MGHLLWGFVTLVLGFLGFLSLSQAFEVVGHVFVLLARYRQAKAEETQAPFPGK